VVYLETKKLASLLRCLPVIVIEAGPHGVHLALRTRRRQAVLGVTQKKNKTLNGPLTGRHIKIVVRIVGDRVAMVGKDRMETAATGPLDGPNVRARHPV
jgi:hypothetical protein